MSILGKEGALLGVTMLSILGGTDTHQTNTSRASGRTHEEECTREAYNSPILRNPIIIDKNAARESLYDACMANDRAADEYRDNQKEMQRRRIIEERRARQMRDSV